MSVWSPTLRMRRADEADSSCNLRRTGYTSGDRRGALDIAVAILEDGGFGGRMIPGIKVAIACLVLVANLTAIYVGWSIVRRITRMIGHPVEESRSAKLVALLLAAIVIREAILSFVIVGIHALQTMLVYQPIAVATYETGGKFGSYPDAADVFEAVLRFAAVVIREGIAELRLESLPWLSLLVLVALWAAFYLLIKRLRAEMATDPQNGKRAVLHSSTLFVIILVFGLFLSFAAIVAIPVLQEPGYESVEATPAKLEERLEAFGRVLRDEARFPKDPFEPAGKQTDAAAMSGTVTVTPPVDAGASAAQQPADALAMDASSLAARSGASAVEAAEARRKILVARWHVLQSSTVALAQRDREQAVSTFRIGSVGHKVNRETSAHIGELTNWYETKITEYAASMDACLQDIRFVNGLPPHDGETTTLGWCGVRQDYGVPPGRHAAGGELGLFSFLAQWLLAAESVPLALVVGMLGFGVLGAAISSFVRERAREPSPEMTPLAYDVPRMLMKGTSAAIVLFLGVEGGLAVFAGKDAQPNPYVLFFACFSAAVFSERVWDWAQNKLVSEFVSSRPPSSSVSRAPQVNALSKLPAPPEPTKSEVSPSHKDAPTSESE
jgi:hypothetical protein